MKSFSDYKQYIYRIQFIKMVESLFIHFDEAIDEEIRRFESYGQN